MLGKRRKTGVMQDLTETISVKVDYIGKRNLPISAICKICIVLFSCSIIVGVSGLVSRMDDISKKEQSIEKLRNEHDFLKSELDKKQKLKQALIDDTLTIEAVARSYGMSKKGERIFYFVD
ncbi:MAG: septum formation initiator family protein [Fibromonadales bacterium]|nr:septum formation initiator family protein [Fibromonadales bacterium]